MCVSVRRYENNECSQSVGGLSMELNSKMELNSEFLVYCAWDFQNSEVNLELIKYQEIQ